MALTRLYQNSDALNSKSNLQLTVSLPDLC